MSLTKIVFAVAVITFICFTFSHSLKCYVCNSTDSCKKAGKQECTPSLANATLIYLASYHTNVNVNKTSSRYQCFSENLQLYSGSVYYKGCTYDNIDGCRFPLSTPGKTSCYQCTGNGCNPAERVYTNVMTVFATVFITSIVSYVWH